MSPPLPQLPIHRAQGLVKKADDGDNVVASLKEAAQICQEYGLIDPYLNCLEKLASYYMRHNYVNQETLNVLIQIRHVFSQVPAYLHRLEKHDEMIRNFKILIQKVQMNDLTVFTTGGSHSPGHPPVDP